MSRVEDRRPVESPKARASGSRRRKAALQVRHAPPAKRPVVEPVPLAIQRRQLIFVASAVVAGVWAYWPTLVKIVSAWNNEPDYSHGYLILPMAIAFLWARRKQFPGIEQPAYAIGAMLLLLSIVARYFCARFFYAFLDGYSILLWLAALAALAGGWRFLVWTLPSIGFLFFMIPLPFSVEGSLSMPLQRIATKLTCWTLQTLGQPAFREGNVILLGEHQLEVAQACSGLRLFMSVVAMAYAYIAVGDLRNLRGIILSPARLAVESWLRFVKLPKPPIEPELPDGEVTFVKRTWWQNGILLLSIIPIAIVSNAARIVVTGLLYQVVSGDVAHKFSHDFAGFAMIPLAAALFALVLWYLSKLIREEEIMEMSAVVRQMRT